jgi:nitroreductase
MAELEDVIRTTFSCREFADQPVADDDIAQILELARFASSGGNRQGWRVVALRSAESRAAVIEASLPMARRYVAQGKLGELPFSTVAPTAVTDQDVAQVGDAAVQWYAGLADAPVILVVGLDRNRVAAVDLDVPRIGVTAGASVYPFVHNILLLARGRGLAGVLTTFASGVESDIQSIVGFPPDVAVAALVPLGYPRKVVRRLRREPVSSFARWDRWDGRPVGADGDSAQ